MVVPSPLELRSHKQKTLHMPPYYPSPQPQTTRHTIATKCITPPYTARTNSILAVQGAAFLRLTDGTKRHTSSTILPFPIRTRTAHLAYSLQSRSPSQTLNSPSPHTGTNIHSCSCSTMHATGLHMLHNTDPYTAAPRQNPPRHRQNPHFPPNRTGAHAAPTPTSTYTCTPPNPTVMHQPTHTPNNPQPNLSPLPRTKHAATKLLSKPIRHAPPWLNCPSTSAHWLDMQMSLLPVAHLSLSSMSSTRTDHGRSSESLSTNTPPPESREARTGTSDGTHTICAYWNPRSATHYSQCGKGTQLLSSSYPHIKQRNTPHTAVTQSFV